MTHRFSASSVCPSLTPPKGVWLKAFCQGSGVTPFGVIVTLGFSTPAPFFYASPQPPSVCISWIGLRRCLRWIADAPPSHLFQAFFSVFGSFLLSQRLPRGAFLAAFSWSIIPPGFFSMSPLGFCVQSVPPPLPCWQVLQYMRKLHVGLYYDLVLVSCISLFLPRSLSPNSSSRALKQMWTFKPCSSSNRDESAPFDRFLLLRRPRPIGRAPSMPLCFFDFRYFPCPLD